MIKDRESNQNNKKIIFIIIALIILVLLLVAIFWRSFVGCFIWGFGTKQPISIELIQYNWTYGTEETIFITDNEEIIELYDAIRYANIKKVQFDSEGLETDAEWVIILHFTNEDIYLSTQGEGMKDSIYFRRYLEYDYPNNFIEVWLYDSKLKELLQNYVK